MRDRLFLYAIGVSFLVHIGAVCVIGRTSASRLDDASVSQGRQYVNVELLPEEIPSPPQPVTPNSPPKPLVSSSQPDESTSPNSHPATDTGPRPPRPVRTHGSGHPNAGPGDPGGKSAIGPTIPNGNIRGNGNGATTSGWVPNNDGGPGNGSGTGPGVGTPEPPRNVNPGPETRPGPAPPPPPPAPKMVSVKVCEESGMAPGDHCKSTRTKSFVDGEEPKRTCNKCKAPESEHVPIIVERSYPELIRDAKPRVPDSVDEGLTLTATVEYYSDADGGTSGARIAKSSGNSDLDRAILSAASQWKYKPAVQGGVARRVKMTRSLKFRT